MELLLKLLVILINFESTKINLLNPKVRFSKDEDTCRGKSNEFMYVGTLKVYVLILRF